MTDVQVDILTPTGNGGFTGGGSAGARLLANNMDPGALRPFIGNDGRAYITVNTPGGPEVRPVGNATLRKDEWKQFDEAIVKAAQQRLIGVADLYYRGLVYRISNGLGTTVLETETMSDTEDAQVSMDAATRGRRDRPEFNIGYLPLPIIHKDFQLDIRTLNASRTRGQALDTIQAEQCARKIAEKAESMLFTGLSTYTYGGGSIYGYLDYTHRNNYTLEAHWNDSAATGETILADVLGMIQESIDARYHGPWVLYIPTNFQTALSEDFKANSDKSVRQRLLEVEGLSDIKVADFLTADNVLLVQMTSDVVRIVEGLAIQTIQWELEGGMLMNFKVMAIMVPQIRADYDNRCGIVHGTK
jgi:uncharacterized linocin/CFP29 family protein